MSDELRWSFELTASRIPVLQQRMTWALQRQNDRFARRFQDRPPTTTVGFALAVVCVVLVVTAVVVDPRHATHQPLAFAVACLVAAAALLISLKKPRAGKPLGQRLVGRSLARDVDKEYRRVARQVPYTIEYRLDAEQVEARVDRLGIVRRTPLRKPRLVLHAPEVMFLFRFRWSFQPYRVIYVPSEVEHDAVVAALARHGVATEALDGPVDGYEAPIPEARVAR